MVENLQIIGLGISKMWVLWIPIIVGALYTVVLEWNDLKNK